MAYLFVTPAPTAPNMSELFDMSSPSAVNDTPTSSILQFINDDSEDEGFQCAQVVPSLRFIPSSPVVDTADTGNPFDPIVVPSDSDNPEPVHDDSDTDFEIANKRTGGTFRFTA